MQLYSGKHHVLYGQIGMWDSGDPTAYPTPNGPLPWWGAKGVVVPACTDEDVEILVLVSLENEDALEKLSPAYTLLSQGVISVANGAVTLGNITSASTANVPIANGKYEVSTHFVGRDPAETTAVAFKLKTIRE